MVSENVSLSVLCDELQSLETETFEIQDHAEAGTDLLLVAADSCSTSSCSTSSSTTSCTSTASCD